MLPVAIPLAFDMSGPSQMLPIPTTGGPSDLTDIAVSTGSNNNSTNPIFDTGNTTPSGMLENGTTIFAVLQGFTADVPESPQNHRRDSRTLQVRTIYFKMEMLLIDRILTDHCQGKVFVPSWRTNLPRSSHALEWQPDVP